MNWGEEGYSYTMDTAIQVKQEAYDDYLAG